MNIEFDITEYIQKLDCSLRTKLDIISKYVFLYRIDDVSVSYNTNRDNTDILFSKLRFHNSNTKHIDILNNIEKDLAILLLSQ